MFFAIEFDPDPEHKNEKGWMTQLVQSTNSVEEELQEIANLISIAHLDQVIASSTFKNSHLL